MANKFMSLFNLKSGENSRKTVTFGDTSIVNSPGGRVWSYGTVLFLIGLWYFSGIYNWVNPLFWPPIEEVWGQFIEISNEGFRNFTLIEHIGISLMRILSGFFFGCLVGIPLGYMLALSKVLNRILDPIVEFFRPMPPLALIPLVILWLGIGETAKIFLLFLAAVWIMALASRSGVMSTNIAKVHAAYTLNASKIQLLRYVILPNSLPDIFTGMRVCMGVCWGTVVAAELVAAESGIGMMIMVASKFLESGIVVLGVILISLIAYSIDILMRTAENKLVPWRGKVKT